MGCKLCFVRGSENFVGNFIHLNDSICLHTLRFTFKFEVIHLFEIYEFGLTLKIAERVFFLLLELVKVTMKLNVFPMLVFALNALMVKIGHCLIHGRTYPVRGMLIKPQTVEMYSIFMYMRS